MCSPKSAFARYVQVPPLLIVLRCQCARERTRGLSEKEKQASPELGWLPAMLMFMSGGGLGFSVGEHRGAAAAGADLVVKEHVVSTKGGW